VSKPPKSPEQTKQEPPDRPPTDSLDEVREAFAKIERLEGDQKRAQRRVRDLARRIKECKSDLHDLMLGTGQLRLPWAGPAPSADPAKGAADEELAEDAAADRAEAAPEEGEGRRRRAS
jgi:hypothetical protein